MQKIAFLLKRKDGSDLADFQQSILALSASDPKIPGLSAYIQCHTLLKGYARGELLFDVVEEFEFESANAASAFRSSETYNILWNRRATIIEGAASVSMDLDVYCIKDTPLSAGGVKNFEFVNIRPGMSLEAFGKYWRENHGPLAAQIKTIQRYEQNHLAQEAYKRNETPMFDGFATTWFESTRTMRETASNEIYAAVRADEVNFVPDGRLPVIITQEVMVRR